MEKLKGGLFVGTQIRRFIKYIDFINVITVPESDAYHSLVLAPSTIGRNCAKYTDKL